MNIEVAGDEQRRSDEAPDDIVNQLLVLDRLIQSKVQGVGPIRRPEAGACPRPCRSAHQNPSRLFEPPHVRAQTSARRRSKAAFPAQRIDALRSPGRFPGSDKTPPPSLVGATGRRPARPTEQSSGAGHRRLHSEAQPPASRRSGSQDGQVRCRCCLLVFVVGATRRDASQERLRNLTPGLPRTWLVRLSRLRGHTACARAASKNGSKASSPTGRPPSPLADKAIARPTSRNRRGTVVPGSIESRRCLMTHLRSGDSASFMACLCLLEGPHDDLNTFGLRLRDLERSRHQSSTEVRRRSDRRDPSGRSEDHRLSSSAARCCARSRVVPSDAVPFQTGLLCLGTAFSRRCHEIVRSRSAIHDGRVETAWLSRTSSARTNHPERR